MTLDQLFDSFALEGKITQKHAEQIKTALAEYKAALLKKIMDDGMKDYALNHSKRVNAITFGYNLANKDWRTFLENYLMDKP